MPILDSFTRRMRLLALPAAVLTTALLAFTPGATTPPRPAYAQMAPLSLALDTAEHAATLRALRPPKRARPVVAVLANAVGTETTDYLVPYGVLRRSGIADVWALSTVDGPVRLHPALVIRPQATVTTFDARYPQGADYVIVPAMHNEHDPAVLEWITAQRAKGATIVGVCSGARVLSNAGFLHGLSATGHWYDVSALQKQNPDMRYVRDRRYVAENGIVTTTGVSASLPIALALVEAIAGRDTAAAVARSFGVTRWDPSHNSAQFQRRRFLYAAAGINVAQFWHRDRVEVPVTDGVDEVALALTADAWSRTYRSRAFAVHASPEATPVMTRGGLTLLPDSARKGQLPNMRLRDVPAAAALDTALAGIRSRFGARTERLVALQLEYAAPQP